MDNIGKLFKIIEKNEAKFISLKYYSSTGGLQQIDAIIKSLIIVEDFILINSIKLRPIENKCFFDPFRSYPTIFCLCDNLSNSYNPRLFLKEMILGNDLANNSLNDIEFELTINFFIFNESENFKINKDELIDYQNQSDPYDQLANLRTEIVDILEKIGVPTVFHCHAKKIFSCSVRIKAQHFLEIADYWIISYFIISNVAKSYGKTAYFLNDLPNELYIMLPESKYNQELAISIILSIMCNLNSSSSNIYFVKQPIKDIKETITNISKHYYSHDQVINSHNMNLQLYHPSDPYLAISYLIVYGLQESYKIKDKLSKKILETYFRT